MAKIAMRILNAFLCVCLLLTCIPAVGYAEEIKEAEEISSVNLIGPNSTVMTPNGLFDGDLFTSNGYASDTHFTLDYASGIGSLYLMFNYEYGTVRIDNNDTKAQETVDTMGILHKFIDLKELFGECPTSVTIWFNSGDVVINEMRVFTEGKVPDDVQIWNPPADGEADLLLLSTHGDDEQLFFAGILPYYEAELGMKVQVLYFTNHRNRTTTRTHEMLNGLWAVGVRTYPVIGNHPDILTNNTENAYANLRLFDFSDDDLVGFVVEAIRRFKPYVIVGHDINGEYGHGMHMLYTDLLMRAVQYSGVEGTFKDSEEKYGVWDPPKTYLHLYDHDEIVVDWDIPLDSFDGMTAFEVTKNIGFPCHASQVSDFQWYFAGAQKASDIQGYSPCKFGLYRTTVGKDVEKNDFFENIDFTARGAELSPEPETEPVEPETIPVETEESAGETAAPVEETTAVPAVPPVATESKDGGWIVFPAVGAAVLLVLAAVLNLLQKKS